MKFWNPNRKVRTAKRKKLGKAALAVYCACAVIMTSFNPALPAANVHAAAPAKLNNLVIDKVYELHPTGEIPEGSVVGSNGFSPEITQYEGTAYSSVDEIKIYPFAASSTATVTVNDVNLTNGYITVRVETPGDYPVKVKVSDGGSETTYHIVVKKVDSDYRERRAITLNDEIMGKLSVTTEAGNKDKLMEILKKEHLVMLPPTSQQNIYVDTTESYWETSSPPASVADSQTLTSFTVDLGDVYSVSRIRAVVGPSNLNLKNKVRISVSTDGINWEVPITKGNLNTGIQWHQNVIRYEFGVSHQTRFIKYEITDWVNKQKNLRLYQFMIYYDAGTVPAEQPAPDGGSVPYQHEERHQYLASGQATVIERGLPLSGWTPSDGYGRGIPTREEARQFGYDGPLFYDPDFGNKDYMLYNPDSHWGIAKAPFGGNTMGSAGEPRDFIAESMKPYINNAVSFCFGDEGGYSTSEAKSFAEWFQWTREHYPGIILHSNQFPNQWSEANLKEYFKIAKPDMITWDDYYGKTSESNPSSLDLAQPGVQINAARSLMGLNTWELYRKLAYQGIDGTGNQPILFGQYLDAFATNHTVSAKNMIANLSVLSGAKWLNFFRLEYQFDRCYLWDEDGTPTKGLLEWGQIIDRIHAVDDQSNRLNNDWIMFKTGSIGNAASPAAGFRRGEFGSAQSMEKNAEFGLTDIAVKSLSRAHGGGTGDVVLGYFNTLPGLYESEIAEYFEGATAPKAFMVMNGLIAGNSETNNRIDIPGRESGSSENTRQEITITTSPDFRNETLYLVDKDDRDEHGNGVIKKVDIGTDGRFTLALGGGESNLYFWAQDTTAKADSQSEGAYASFAFDGLPGTYWMPSSATADNTYIIEKTFAPISIDQAVIMEKGNAIQGYQLEYLTEDGNWLPFGASGERINTVEQVVSDHPVRVYGVRLKITKAEGIPAIYDITYSSIKGDPNQVRVVTVNDNTMGTGLNRFQYDDTWSYRENEIGGTLGLFPLEGDGHYSNFDKSVARFQFYGTKAELLLRSDQASNIKAQVFDQSDNPVGAEKTGSTGSLVFDNLPQDLYTLLITKKNISQASIDGVKVTYQGALPKDADEGERAEQVYVNQRVTSNQLTDYFTFEPQWKTVNMGANNNDFNVYETESGQWVEHVQNLTSHNCGFTRTNRSGSSYTFQFYGTGVQLYSSALPVDGRSEIPYGKLQFELDGIPVEVRYKNVTSEDSKWGTNAKISLRVAEIQVPNASENQNHTLKVTVDSGYNRIDYAVVDRYASSGDYKVNLDIREHGSAAFEAGPEVTEGGAAAIRVTPNSGYQIADIVVNGKAAQIPEDGILIIKNIRENVFVKITFRRQLYPIALDDTMQGGSVVPEKFMAEAGTAITVKPEPYVGQKLKLNSVTVTDDAGASLVITPVENESFRFIMPDKGVKLKAEFEAIPYAIEAGNLVNGKVLTDPASQAVYRQIVTVRVQPDEGYRLVEESLKAVLEKGGALALDETGNPAERTFSMPAQKVTLTAIFEKIPEYTIAVDDSVKNGKVDLEKTEVEAGGQVTVSFKPDAGYVLGTLYLNQEPWYVPKGDLVLKNIDSDIIISPDFVASNHTFHTGSAVMDNGEGGSVEPKEQWVLNHGNAVLIAHPNQGYRARSVTVKTRVETASESNAQRYETASGSNAQRYEAASGSNAMEESMEISKDYPFPDGSNKIVIPNLTGDIVMSVAFERILYPINVDKADHGTLTTDMKKAGYGQIVTVKAMADQGYRLKEDSLKVATETGEQQNLSETEFGKVYTFQMPLSPVAISAQFETDPYPPTDPEKPNPPTDPEKPNPPTDPEKPNPPTDPEKPPQPDVSSDEGTPIYTGTPGWNSDRKGWRYRKNGVYAVSSWEYLDWNGQPGWYYFGPDEYMVSGWFLDQTGNWYYLDPVSDGTKGRMMTGWLLDTDGHWYYLNPVSDGFMGKMALGWQEIQGKWYYFNNVSDGTKGALSVDTTTPDGVQVGSDGAKKN